MLALIGGLLAASSLLATGVSAREHLSGPGRFGQMERQTMNMQRDIVEEYKSMSSKRDVAANESDYRFYTEQTSGMILSYRLKSHTPSRLNLIVLCHDSCSHSSTFLFPNPARGRVPIAPILPQSPVHRKESMQDSHTKARRNSYQPIRSPLHMQDDNSYRR